MSLLSRAVLAMLLVTARAVPAAADETPGGPAASTSDAPSGPTSASMGVTVRVPARPPCFPVQCGALTLTAPMTAETWFSDPRPAMVDGHMVGVATAAIPTVVVTDARPGFLPWSTTGQFGLLRAGPGSVVPARNLGWEPWIVRGTGALPGERVLPGYPGAGGSGLAAPRVLGSAVRGHNGNLDPVSVTTLGGMVTVYLPKDTKPGDYRGTLTLTLVA